MMLSDSNEVVNAEKPRLPREFPWFCWTFSPWDLSIDRDGYLAANPAVLIGKPGVNGVGEDRNGQINIGNALERHRAGNRARLDDKVACVARGKRLAGYRAEYKPSLGRPQYHDVWQSWTLEAGEWVCDVDADGYALFLRTVAADMKPTPAQIARAVRRARQEGRDDVPSDPWIHGKNEPAPRGKNNAREG